VKAQTMAANRSVLLVEDEDDDIFFVQKAFEKAGINNRLHVALDGQQAIDYLSGKGQYSDRSTFPLPALVILDLKLPKVWGMDVLKWIRANPALRSLPVVVFTGSDDALDAQRAYRLGANSYFQKPPNLENLYDLVPNLCEFWLKWNRLPPLPAAAPAA
jgi:CheY-like chemotaxis protein